MINDVPMFNVDNKFNGNMYKSKIGPSTKNDKLLNI